MKYEKLYEWLKDTDSNMTFVRDCDRQENLMKVSYNSRIDLIFHQRVIDAHVLSSKLPFYYCGIYNKQDGKLYDTAFPLRGNLLAIETWKTRQSMQKEYNKAIHRYLIQYLEENADKIRESLPEDESPEKKYKWCNDDDFKEFARERFPSGLKSEDISFKIHCIFEFAGQMSLIRYVDNPSESVKEEAERFLASNQDLVRCIIREHDRLKYYLKRWESLNNGDSHKAEGERVCEI